MDKRYAELLGITQLELENYFAESLNKLAAAENIPKKELFRIIKFWYNGYRFTNSDIYVYNPFSLLLLFAQLEFKYYWFETGTP